MDAADHIAGTAVDHSASGIAAAVNRLIKSGELPPGTQLPTVRALAGTLETSPTTVSEAWRSLVRIGSVRTDGRRGSFVADDHRSTWPGRFWRIAQAAGEFRMDLSAGVPDPDLLPPLHDMLRRVHDAPQLSGYLDAPVLPELEGVIRDSWPHPGRPESVTVMDGSLDALDRVLTGTLRLGDTVLVENPTFPPFLDLLELIGARPVAVDTDAEGLRAESLRAALADGPSPAALVLQPRAHNPTGASVTAHRAAELADALRAAPECLVIEDDHAGDIAIAEPVSLATHCPDRTLTVRSFSKSHGPDLRLAVVGGPAELLEPIIARRNLGPAWSSRLLQRLLADMLTDRQCVETVARARNTYARRREALTTALAERGLTVTARDGFNVWVDVARERDALVTLAARGIGAAPGKPFLAAGTGGDHLRVTTAPLPVGDAADVADALVDAARPPGGHRSAYR